MANKLPTKLSTIVITLQAISRPPGGASDATALSRTPISFETEFLFDVRSTVLYLRRRYLLNWQMYPVVSPPSRDGRFCSAIRPSRRSPVGARRHAIEPSWRHNTAVHHTSFTTGRSGRRRRARDCQVSFAPCAAPRHKTRPLPWRTGVCVRGYIGELGTEVRGGREVRSKGVKVKWDTYPGVSCLFPSSLSVLFSYILFFFGC